MKKEFRGSVTIEASFIVPLIILVVGVVLYVLFYYHDKNVLLGTAHETAAYGANHEQVDEDTLESYFVSRINGKLLLLTKVEKEIVVEDEEVAITCSASKSRMSVQVKCAISRTNPEDYIRSVRKLIKIGEKIGD